MSDLRKAAELAFDALDIYREHDAENIGLADAAYEALRQALAQPEQEPVAWMNIEDNIFYKYEFKSCAESDKNAVPLYTAPPKREWVGLTDEDLKPLCDEWRIMYGGYINDFARSIEAKLKEKNT